MTSVVLNVPIELKEKMDAHPEMDWSAIARHAFTQRIRDYEFMKEFASESEFTEEDALRLGREVNKKVARHYQGMD